MSGDAVTVRFLPSLSPAGTAITTTRAYRTPSGWRRVAEGARETAFDPISSRRLDALLAAPGLVDAPCAAPPQATDRPLFEVTIRHAGREVAYTGDCVAPPNAHAIGGLVLNGRILDWTGVPLADWPTDPLPRRLGPQYERGFGSGAFSAIESPRRIALQSEAEFAAQWARIFANTNPRPLPKVDFAKDAVVMFATGPWPTGGQSIAIDRIARVGDVLWVHVTQETTGNGCVVTLAVTSPVDLAVVPRGFREVRWAVETKSEDCM